VFGACAFVFSTSQAEASCGDWLQHTSFIDFPRETIDHSAQANGNAFQRHSHFPVAPCRGPNCRQRSSEPFGLPLPTVEPNVQERWCGLAEELPPLSLAICYGVSLNAPRSTGVVHAPLLRPPSLRAIVAAAA
jgi:hypothetical protein